VFRKKNSLSTGERIATDAANILREKTFSPLLKRYIDANIIEQFHGYVDDCMSVVHGVDNSVLDALLNDLNAVETPHAIPMDDCECESAVCRLS